jgi:hypothetical protein
LEPLNTLLSLINESGLKRTAPPRCRAVTAKALRARDISRQRGATANAGFHLLKTKQRVVISASQFCVPSASTGIINPSNARGGADDHAAHSARDIHDPA